MNLRCQKMIQIFNKGLISDKGGSESIKVSIEHVVGAVSETAVVADLRALHHLVVDTLVRLIGSGNWEILKILEKLGTRNSSSRKILEHLEHLELKKDTDWNSLN